jgi:diguanylate cyclase (GGDEF)-like protein
MTEKSKRTIWILWVLLWPISVLAILVYSPSSIHHSYLDVGLMAAMIIVIALSYFQVKGTDILVIQSVSMAVFLLYGLATEMVLVQLGIIAYIFSQRQSKSFWYRYPLNMLMFLFSSVTSAAFYYILGGQAGPMPTGQSLDWVPVLGYAFMAFFSNHIAFYLVSKAIYDEAKFLGKSVQWEVITTLLTLPVSLILYILYSEFGTSAILMVSIPIITLSVIFRLISRVYTYNQLLQETSQIGRELSHTLEVKSVYPLFFKSLHSVINVDVAILINMDDKGKVVSVASFNELGEETLIHPDVSLFDPIACKQRRSFLAISQKKWEPFMFHLLPEEVHSVMMLPISIDQELNNLLIVANKDKGKFEKPHQMIFEIMTNFFSVAIDNARNYEKTKMESERDPLTHLYNYRYFTRKLDQKFEALKTQTFSIIMIDLDHFKKINDVYGHENGNHVLKQVAELLGSVIGEQDIVARYGGEEFIILLDEANEEKSYYFAERLRHLLSIQQLKMDRFSDTDQPQYIQVTASMGVATAPDQGEDALTLIRNADRTMYSGAKQKGRNRVSVYAR